MMNLRPLFLPVLLVSVSANAQTTTSGLKRPYDIKSCKIVFKFVNGPQSGEKTVIFDNWGRSEKEEVTTITDTSYMANLSADSVLRNAFNKTPSVQHQGLIHQSGQAFVFDLDRNVGYKRNYVPMEPDLALIGQREVGKDTILGKPCKILEIHGAFRIWYWGKIALKKELIEKGASLNVQEYAVSIDENYVITPDEFKVPPSVKLR
jgi:hypothetical protein